MNCPRCFYTAQRERALRRHMSWHRWWDEEQRFLDDRPWPVGCAMCRLGIMAGHGHMTGDGTVTMKSRLRWV